jgi:HK97 gp10 family phage protein
MAARVDITQARNYVKRKMEAYAVEYIRRAVRQAASYAKTNHPYQDRTGNLTKSIQSVPTSTGAYLSARMPYAHFVEWGTRHAKPYPYLRPAIEYVVKLLQNKRGLAGASFEKT